MTGSDDWRKLGGLAGPASNTRLAGNAWHVVDATHLRQWHYLALKVGLQKEGDGVALHARGIHHPVQRGAVYIVCPALQQVANIADIGALYRGHVHPLAALAVGADLRLGR